VDSVAGAVSEAAVLAVSVAGVRAVVVQAAAGSK
jgi:hypothetical protein